MRFTFCVACGNTRALAHLHLAGRNDAIITLCANCCAELPRVSGRPVTAHGAKVLAGQARARAAGRRVGKQGNPAATEEAIILALRAQGLGIIAIRTKLRCGSNRVQAVIARAEKPT